jgi:hypothetical protein
MCRQFTNFPFHKVRVFLTGASDVKHLIHYTLKNPLEYKEDLFWPLLCLLNCTMATAVFRSQRSQIRTQVGILTGGFNGNQCSPSGGLSKNEDVEADRI